MNDTRTSKPAALPASAYIDGGTASMVFQLLIAGGLVALFTVRTFWSNLKSFASNFVRRGTPRDGQR